MVSEDWKLSTLGDICEGNIQTGPFGSQLYAHEYTEDGPTAVVMPKDIVDGALRLEAAARVNRETADRLAKHRLRSGDLLFSRRGDVARSALITDDTDGNLCGTGCLRARPSSNHNPRYLAYQLQLRDVRLWLERNAVGQTMPNLNTSILSRLPLTVGASRHHENVVVDILSTWDQAIETVDELIQNSEAQQCALMQQLLSSGKRLTEFANLPRPLMPLSQVTEFIRDGTHGTHERMDHGIPLLSAVNVLANGVIDFDGAPNVTQADYDKIHGKYEIQEDDVLLTVVGTLGRAALVPKCDRFTLQRSVAIIRSGPSLDPRYLFRFVQSSLFQRELKKRANVTAQPGVYLGELAKIEIPVPGAKEQEKIAEILDCADRYCQMLSLIRTCLRNEKTALMQQLLTGKKRVRTKKDAEQLSAAG